MNALSREIAVLLSVSVTLLLAACGDNRLGSVKRAGEIVILTRNSPTTYYEGPDGPAGFEYDMARTFADELGVKLRLVFAERYNDIVPMLLRGEADMAAAGLAEADAPKETLWLTPPHQEVSQQVVYRQGTNPPAGVRSLIGRELDVRRGSSYAERLLELRQEHPDLKWQEIEDMEAVQLLQTVAQGLLELTIADSNIIAIYRQYYPELQIAFDISEKRMLTWAFPAGGDDSLYKAAVRFHKKMHKSGELQRLMDRYYGTTSRYDSLNLTVFQAHIQNRLPQYQALFEQAGAKHDLDWRLLAALGYQESRWNPRAVSPTGVRGIMMLTRRTAEYMDVENRLEPEQSIDGGAQYIRSRIDRMPGGVQGPDRIWMALAAYNVGIGHLEDARIITQKQGDDPNKWVDVKERLPLLSLEAWYSKTKHGYARGEEPVRFVDRVRTYYDILVKLDEEEKAKNMTDAFKLQAPAI